MSAADRTPVTAVVVGSGIAGLVTALHAAAAGAAVTLVTKDVLESANTRYAQGGIAAVMFAEDSAEAHLADTLAASAGLADPEAVHVLVDEGPDRIRELVALGVAFDRTPEGAFRRGLEAAHSFPRVLHAGGDATGAAIEQALVAAVRASAVRVIEHAFLLDVVVADGRARGVELLVDGRRMRLRTDAVVLATGGAGQLYAHTTNPVVATADGIAAALRAGAAVADLEFVQFHPTVLAAGEPFLVSEAVRGEGAVLVDDSGRRFAFDAHPDGELAPRDVVARAISRTIARQGGRPALLDATALGGADTSGFLAERFPTIDAAVRERGLDWADAPIPVTPAAHYLMGGVTTDLHGRTTVPGLYAVGETARTGVHGANRLASNSLLEGAVFGARTGDVLAADAARSAWPVAVAMPTAPSDTVRPVPARHATAFSRSALQQLMWEFVGLERDATGLRRAADTLTRWSAEHREPRTIADFEDENLLRVAREVVAAAERRTGSVGAHFRADDPGTGGSAPAEPTAAVVAC
ncbi:L-aspartate oxidase [Microbacterium sp. SORGH_AS_0888]|uniref:L-aspartate oxidase n=1 Tax=Microbacterium sp. SORGH_AS_0888 TaxID=3041791 RepID=UPI00277E6637|nr:L-aspartate oxidase [Microbacterium sp. SORGH_AS_0888]MDQ1128159.1 L-aspartate oxidase [Microbacterium sp. SORGH_AS_0888]